MTQDTNIINQWIELFVDSDSPDQKISNSAIDTIRNKINSDGEFLISVCSQILIFEPENKENVIKSQCVASKILLDMICVQNQNELEFNQSNLNDDIIEQIKTALKKTIISDNASIVKDCQKAYSYLFATLTTKWQDGIDNIINSLTNHILFPLGIIHLISTMREIIHLFNFISEIIQPFQRQFTQSLAFAVDILSKDPNDGMITSELRTNCANYIVELIQVYPSIINTDQIPKILDTISNSFEIYDKDLYISLKSLLFIFVKNFYDLSPKFFDKIIKYINNGIDLSSTHPDCAIPCIDFWKEIAELENSIIKKCKIKEKLREKEPEVKPLSPLLTETGAIKLLPKFIELIKDISEEDTQVEDIVKMPKPSMYATVSVSFFYELLPEKVFNLLSERIKQEQAEAKKWTDQHGILLMIYAIIENPTNDKIGEFVSDYFDFIIKCSEKTNVPRLRETALYVLCLILKNYPQIVTKNDKPMISWLRKDDPRYIEILKAKGDTENKINQIIQLIKSSCAFDEEEIKNLSNDDLLILIRLATIIYHVSSLRKRFFFHKFNYFDQLYECIKVLFNIGVMNNNSKLITEATESFYSLLYYATPDFSQNLSQIYKQNLTALEKSMNDDIDSKPEIKHIIQSSYLTNISSILFKLYFTKAELTHELLFEHAQKTLEIVYKLLNYQVKEFYEEGLMVISALIILASGEKPFELFSPESFNKLLTEIIYNALISLEPCVIKSACQLIIYMYKHLKNKIPELLQAIPYIFFALSSLILDHKELKEAFPAILEAIADIFYFTDFSNNPKPDLESQYCDLIMKIYDLSTELDMTKEEDVDFGNLFYQYLLDALAGYVKTYFDIVDLNYQREQLYIFDKVSVYVWKLCPKFKVELYESYMNAAKQFAYNCSRINNVILNSNSVHRILKFGYENTKSILKKSLKETIDYLESK